MIKKNNIQGEIQSYNSFEVYAYLTEDSDIIKFQDQTSIDRIAFMCPGDQIIGKTIPNDVFIESINEKDCYIKVSQPMDITVDQTITVLSKVQFYPKENLTDFYKYRIADSKNKQAKNENVFENYINVGKSDEISNFMFMPAIDISSFRDNLLTNIQNQNKLRRSFNQMCKYLYKKTGTKIAQPSTFNCEGDLLMDINAYTCYTDSGEEYIMHQKVLDYVEEYKDDISRVSDALSIGVSINGITNSEGDVLEDKNIKSRFRTTSNWGTDIPYYVKIGTGKLDDSVFEVNQTNDNENKSIQTFYNDESESYYDDQYWSTHNQKNQLSENNIYDIDKPLFKAQLGEYEVLNNINFKYSDKSYTAIQFAIMKRMFKDFDVSTNDICVLNSKIKNLDILSFNVANSDNSRVCNYKGHLLDGDSLEYPKDTSFLNYYSLEDNVSYMVFNDETEEYELKKCKIFNGNYESLVKAKDKNDFIYFNNSLGYCTLFLNEEQFYFNYFKNIYYENYIDNIDAQPTDISFSLGVSDIVKGSLDSTFILRENLFANGYEYSEDGLTVDYSKPVEKVSLVEDFIYCDEKNEVLYTYNGDKKLMIFQENNKYFKNIINNVVAFEKETVFSENGTVDNYYITNVEGFKFDINDMSLKDRILSLEKINIRHPYDSQNEPVFFSNFLNVKPYLRGLFFDGDVLDLSEHSDNSRFDFNFGYKFKLTPKSFIEKSKLSIEEKKLKPYNKDTEEAYENNLLEYNKSQFEGKTISAPKYVKSTFTDEQIIIENFEFYKNLIVVEGRVNLNNPTNIYFDIKRSRDALDMIENGDEVVESVLLSSTSQNDYQAPYTIENVLFLDHKNNVFMVGTKNSIIFFNCTNINNLDISNGGHTIELNDNLSSIVWDKDKNKWIYTLENDDGAFAGCYSIRTAYSSVNELPIVDEPIQEFNQLDGKEFNEYQFIRPLKTDDSDIIELSNKEDITFVENEALLARDFSFKTISADCYEENIKKLNKNIVLTKGIEKALYGVGSDFDMESLGSDYVEYEFDAEPSAMGSLSLSNGEGYYIYDKFLGRWRYSESELYSVIAKNVTEEFHVRLICVDSSIVSSEYLSNNGIAITKKYSVEGISSDVPTLGQFLWLLPRPNTNANEFLVVCVVDKKRYLKLSLPSYAKDTSGNATMTLKNISIKHLKVIKKDGRLYNEETLEPYYENNFYVDHYDKNVKMAYNFEGYIAALNGDTLFIKSPTMRWAKHGEEYDYTSPTEGFYWKKAKIPSMKDLSYRIFDGMSVEDAYELVNEQRSLMLDWLNDQLSSNEESNDEILNAFKKWFVSTKSAIITPKDAIYDIKEDYEKELYIESMEFLPSPDGLYANIKSTAVQRYPIPQNIAIQAGKTTEAYVRKQTYMEYLRDYYEIILGCNRLSNFVANGIKDISMTSKDLIIVTKTDNVLTLPLQYTYSRDDIENYNNWNIKSLSSKFEIPNYSSSDKNLFFTKIGYEGLSKNFANSMSLFTDKAYTITCSFLENNVQVYGGYYELTKDIVDYLEKIGTDVREEDKLALYRRPFIVYSQDEGATFQRIDALSVNGFDLRAYDSEVSAIYKSKSNIRIVVSGNGKLLKDDLKVNVSGQNYILTDNQNFEEIQENFEPEISQEFYKAGLVNNTTPYAINKSSFFLATSNANSIVGKIISKDDLSITLASSKFNNSGEDEEVPILLAIKTSKSITEPWKYLNYDARYFTDHNDLKVRYVEQVDSELEANLLYSKNETVGLDDQDLSAIICYNNDLNKTVYAYEEKEGNIIPVVMKNSAGDVVRLFDKNTGFYVVQRNPINIAQTSLSFHDMVKDRLNSDAFVKAYSLNENFEYLGNDFGLTDFFTNNKDNVSLFKVSFDNDNPFIQINVKSKNEDMVKLFDKLFYEWPENFETISEEDLQTNISKANTEFYYKLKELLNDGVLINKEWIMETFEKVEIKLSDTNGTFYGIREKATNTILTKEIVSNFTLSMQYESYFENKVFYNQKVKYSDDRKLLPIDEYSISSIYLGNKGYGGTIDLEEWNDIQPRENDAKAFINRILKNDIGEPIYLCDENNKNIFMRNGLFDAKSSEEFVLSYNNLSKEENIVSCYEGDLDNKKATYNFYKIKDSDLSIYCPQEAVRFYKSEKDENFLTIFRIYYSDIDVSSNERIKVECLTRLYSDENLSNIIDNDSLRIYYKNGALYFSKNDYDNVYSNGDYLKIKVTDTLNGKTKEMLLDISQDDIFVATNVPFVFTNNFIESFDLELNKAPYNVKVLSDDIILSKVKDNILSFKVLRYTDEASFIVNADEKAEDETIKIDLHKLDPILYISTNEATKTRGNLKIYSKVYSNELDVTDLFNIEVLKDEQIVRATYKNIELIKEFKYVDDVEKILNIPNNVFVFNQLSEDITYSVEKNCIINGLYGKYILTQFAYDSFKSLIENLERKVIYDDGKFYEYADCEEEKYVFKNISSTKIQINDDLSNKGNYFILKVLPVSSYYPDVATLNNPEYYSEVSVRDIALFGYDRVWINENVFMKPAYYYDGETFNSESMKHYSIDSWQNKDNLNVWLANKNGKFIKPIRVGDNNINYAVIGLDNGDCSNEIYQSHETRINPCELLYKTSYEMYKNKYFLKGVKSNPFLKKIKVNSTKENGKIKIDAYFFTDIIKRRQLAENRIVDDYFIEYDEVKFIDYLDSNIKFKIYANFNNFGKEDYSYFTGIKYNNIYKNKNTMILQNDLSLESISSFVLDSTEDPENKDKSTVVDITEMGIFSKDNILLAYMTHPKCQYDTKKNHIAYNLLIRD